MFRTPLVIATALAVAFGLGILSSIYALRATVGFGAIALGPWAAFPAAQTVAQVIADYAADPEAFLAGR